MSRYFAIWAVLHLVLPPCTGQITVHKQLPLGFASPSLSPLETTITSILPDGATTVTVSTAALAAERTVLPAYNLTELIPPGIPDPKPPTHLNLQIQGSATNVNGLSIPQKGTFYGFSIEMSVINQLCQSSFPLAMNIWT